jgi:hypothetical protein
MTESEAQHIMPTSVLRLEFGHPEFLKTVHDAFLDSLRSIRD